MLSFRSVNLCGTLLTGQIGLAIAADAQPFAKLYSFARFLAKLGRLGRNRSEHAVKVPTLIFRSAAFQYLESLLQLTHAVLIDIDSLAQLFREHLDESLVVDRAVPHKSDEEFITIRAITKAPQDQLLPHSLEHFALLGIHAVSSTARIGQILGPSGGRVGVSRGLRRNMQLA